MSRGSVVIPALNEAARMGLLIHEQAGLRVRAAIVADGGSTDGTPALAAAAGAQAIHARRDRGHACRTGAAAVRPPANPAATA